MADLGTPPHNVDRDSTVAGTRPATPKESPNSKNGELNEKNVPNVMTRTSSYTDAATVDGNNVAAPTPDDSRLLSGTRLGLVHAGFLTSILLVALDQTIVSTALPKIASQFEALVLLPACLLFGSRKLILFYSQTRPADMGRLRIFPDTSRVDAHLWPNPHYCT
jgi:hypothetical protein